MKRFLATVALALALAGCSGRVGSGAFIEPSGPIHVGDRITVQLGTRPQQPPLGLLLPPQQLHLTAFTITNRTSGQKVSPQLEDAGANTFAFTASSATLPDLPSDPEAIGIYDVSATLDTAEQDGYELDVIQDPDARLPGPSLLEAAPSTGWSPGAPPGPPGGNLRPTGDFSYLASVAITVAGGWGVPDPLLASASVDGANLPHPFQFPPGTGLVQYTITGSFPKIADVSKGRVYRPKALVIVLSETDPTVALKTDTEE
ncbi:MAG: hypothetical protein KGR26_00660 [Cyanobacteria bacterium REEB65]|nr:hypothetical protein [Cyanobacteria bacterium REEB65]